MFLVFMFLFPVLSVSKSVYTFVYKLGISDVGVTQRFQLLQRKALYEYLVFLFLSVLQKKRIFL